MIDGKIVCGVLFFVKLVLYILELLFIIKVVIFLLVIVIFKEREVFGYCNIKYECV